MSAAVDQPAPDFVLSGTDGTPLQLSALRGRRVVLFFYPRDGSPVCTAQACAFRDAYEELTTAGVEVVGVSSDSVESHERFAASRGLPFPILSDRDGSVRRLYGARSAMLFGTTGRVTYLIDEEGVVRDMFSSVFRPLEHVRRARAWGREHSRTGPGRPQEDRIRRRRWFACLLAFIALAGPSASHADARGAPEVRAISFANSPVLGDTYELGEKIEVMVRFNRSVRLTETTLKLALTVGARVRYAEFYAVRVEDGVERDLFFYYTVRADDRDADGISVPGGALLLEEGTVRALTNSNIDADLTHGTVAADARRKVDGRRVTAPRISQVNMFPYAHGDEVHGRTIERDQHVIVMVEFDRAVRVTGTPRVALTIGTETRWASFLATAPWSVLYPESTVSFCYTVQREDHAPDGISIPANALALNGGAITLAGDVETDAVLSHRAYDRSHRGVDGGSAAQGGRPQSDSAASETSTEACDRHLRFA